MTQLLDRAARDHPTAVGIVHGGQRWVWSTVRDLVDRAAARLMDLDVVAGDRVVIVSPTTPAAVVVTFACWRIGAVAVPCDPALPGAVLGDRLAAVDARLVVADVGSLDAVDRARPRVPGCRAVLVTDPARWGSARRRLTTAVTGIVTGRRPGRDHDVLDFDGLLHDGPALVRQSPSTASTPAMVVFDGDNVDGHDATDASSTSGDGTRPRTVTHGQLAAAAAQVDGWLVDLRRGREVQLVTGQLWQAATVTVSVLPAVLAAATLVLPHDHAPRALALLLEREAVSVLGVTPPVLSAIVDTSARRDLRTVRVVVSVGSPLRHVTRRRVADRFDRARLQELVTGPSGHEPALSVLGGRARTGSPVVPVTDTVAVVATLDAPLEPVPVGEVGELLLAGPQLVDGPWRVDDDGAGATDEERQSGGWWCRSGLLASQDEEGTFTLRGRLADAVRRQGRLVFPRRIESALRRHPRVHDAAVVGVPGVADDPELVAVVVPRARRRVTTRRVLMHLTPVLDAAELPDRVVIAQDVPRRPDGSPDRDALRRAYSSDDAPSAGTPPTAPSSADVDATEPPEGSGANPDGDPGRTVQDPRTEVQA